VIADPPVFDGADHVIVSLVPLAVPFSSVGAPGGLAVVIALAAVKAPRPIAFCAATCIVYVLARATLFSVNEPASPGTVVVIHSDDPTLYRTKYPSMGAPPDDGGVHVIPIAVPASATAGLVGVPGVVCTVKGMSAEEDMRFVPVAPVIALTRQE
jgi:hypothetical protein